MIKYYKASKDKEFENTNLLLQVHDELIFEIKNDIKLPLAVKKIRDIMSKAHLPVISFNTPIEVSVGQGNNWDEAH